MPSKIYNSISSHMTPKWSPFPPEWSHLGIQCYRLPKEADAISAVNELSTNIEIGEERVLHRGDGHASGVHVEIGKFLF